MGEVKQFTEDLSHKPGEVSARSIGQVIEQHLDEIVGPATADRLRAERRKDAAE